MKKFVQGLSGAEAMRVLAVLMLGALALIGSRPGFAAAAAPTDSIALTSPNNTAIAESDDYATQVLGDPWDMNNPEDTSYLDHIAPPTLSGGIWTAQTTDQYGSIFLASQGWDTSMEYLGERNGVNYPIDSHRYTHLRLRMNSSVADRMVIWWYTTHNYTPAGNSTFITTQAGWHIYDIDLTAGGPGSNGSWTSQATWAGLRLDPIFYMGHSGATIQLDWARLTPATGSSVTINWTASGTSPISLYLTTSPNGGNEFPIAVNLPSSSRSYTWNSAGLAAGVYYVHAVMGSVSSYSGALLVNQAPTFNLTAPSPSSGEDYATTVLGSPWSMTSVSQMQAWYNLSNITFGPGYMQAGSTNNDPEIWFLAGDAAHAINTSRYHYFNYNLYIQRPSPGVVNGQYYQWNGGPRAIWSPSSNPLNWQQTRVVIGWYNRWLHVGMDLRTAPLEPGSNLGWTGTQSIFRFDPFEDADVGVNPPMFRLGDVRLTADPTVANGGTTAISWTSIKTGGNITLYYNTARAVGGTAIATVPLSQGGYVWPVSGLANGTYWISARADDGLNSFSQVALARLVVSGSHPCPATFADVPSSQPFYSYISDLYCRKIVAGYSDNTFRPNSIATRATLAQWIVQERGWAINTTGGPHFADVSPSNPAYPFVETAYNHGVISGYADLTFHPDALVTRGQASKMVVIAFGWAINTAGGPHFTDVPSGNTFYQDIETIYNHGLISGYADRTFRWGAPLTRGQLSKILDLAQ